MGAIDYHRLPLRQYYWLRNYWLGTAQPTYPAAGTAAKLVITADKTTILNDGTDDCQLVISVQNASNQLINNSVNGTLQITSGPGLLPTGTSWAFTTTDGQQAIEMRSYGTGTITVSATSGSLQPGTITITPQDPVPPVGVRADARNPAPLDGPIILHTDISRPVSVSFMLKKPSRCYLTIYSIQGKMIRRQETGMQQAGNHVVFLNGKGLRSGIFVLNVGIGDEEKAFRINALGMKR
jgi:hypothetical protein